MKLFVTTPKKIRPMILRLNGMKVDSWKFGGFNEYIAGLFNEQYGVSAQK